MAVFQCKMCAGSMKAIEGTSIYECEYCHTKQTVPSDGSDKAANLFNRANELRKQNKFDGAEALYQSIVSEFPEEAEAYWGLCLCRYGIEYVDDPATGRKIPTCHRTTRESIFDDRNYKLAVEFSDEAGSELHKAEAAEIDRLQKEILNIANREEPYDIFICYKETREDGERTIESVIAHDLYFKLTDMGYKVFFARITLETKLGQEYEPYIFSALYSAKLMLVIASSAENINAVWVRNEWSRFLDMMKTDRSKKLIPCFKNMTADELPKEMSHLQGADLNKIGADQDLMLGIQKILPLSELRASRSTYRENVIPASEPSPAPIPAAPAYNSSPSVKPKKRISCLGVIIGVIVFYVVVSFIISMSGYTKKAKERSEAAAQPAAAEVTEAPAVVLGERVTGLEELDPIVSERIETLGASYVYGGVEWEGAFLYMADHVSHRAYADYMIGGLYSKLTLTATPYVASEHFSDESKADLLIINGDTNEIISTTSFDKTCFNTEVTADVTGVKKLRIYAVQQETMYTHLLIKDAKLEPTPKDQLKEEPAKDYDTIRILTPAEGSLVTDRLGACYVCDGIMWDDAFLFRAGNGSPNANLAYEIGGKYSKISFMATPRLGDDVFFKNSKADIIIKDEISGEILASSEIGYESGVIELEADITGVVRLGIYVNKTEDMLAYTLIRDVRLYPAE